MRVEDTYSDDLWKEYFTTKPLSLIDFISTAKDLPLFRHSFELLNDISNNPDAYRFSVLQACIGSGKSLILDCQTLWRIYLLGIMKNPQKFFRFAPSARISIGILAPPEVKDSMLIEPLINLMKHFDIFASVEKQGHGKIRYGKFIECEESSGVLLSIISANGKNILDIIRFSSEADLLGTNPMYITGRELRASGSMSDDDIYQLINKSVKRIRARYGDVSFAGAAFDIPPRSKDNLLDKFLITADNTKYLKVIRLKPVWQLFPERYSSDDGTFLIDLNTARISKTVTPTTIEVPMSLYKSAQYQTGVFIQDYVGLPVGYCITRYMDIMDNIKDLIRSNSIDIVLEHGRLCFQSPAGDMLPIYDD